MPFQGATDENGLGALKEAFSEVVTGQSLGGIKDATSVCAVWVNEDAEGTSVGIR